jgi:hypothetical protein
MRYRSPRHWIETWRSIYGPLQKSFDALPPVQQDALTADLMSLVASLNRAEDGSMVVASTYLEIVIVKH